MQTWKIGTETLEFFDNGHLYLVDGIIVPSVTQIMNVRFGAAYASVPADVLKRAAERGMMIHEQIDHFVKTGEANQYSMLFSDCLEKSDLFAVDSEIPVILHENGTAIAAGRLDLLIARSGDMGIASGDMGIADIKTTKKLNTEYLKYQLNLYRIAFMQCYNQNISFLGGIHLREKATYTEIPIDDACAWNLINEWRTKNE